MGVWVSIIVGGSQGKVGVGVEALHRLQSVYLHDGHQGTMYATCTCWSTNNEATGSIPTYLTSTGWSTMLFTMSMPVTLSRIYPVYTESFFITPWCIFGGQEMQTRQGIETFLHWLNLHRKQANHTNPILQRALYRVNTDNAGRKSIWKQKGLLMEGDRLLPVWNYSRLASCFA